MIMLLIFIIISLSLISTDGLSMFAHVLEQKFYSRYNCVIKLVVIVQDHDTNALCPLGSHFLINLELHHTYQSCNSNCEKKGGPGPQTLNIRKLFVICQIFPDNETNKKQKCFYVSKLESVRSWRYFYEFVLFWQAAPAPLCQ